MRLKKFVAGIMAVALWAMVIAPSAPAYASTLTAAPAADVIISGTGVSAPARYTLADIEALSPSTPTTFSSRNDYGFFRTYTAYGVSLATLLSTSGGSLSSPISVIAGDGFEIDFNGTSGEPLLSQTRYDFPNANSGAIDGSNHWVSGQGSPYTDGAVAVDPMLSWSGTYVTADPGSDPAQTPIAVTSQPRVIMGQLDPQDYNTSKFVQTSGGTTQIVVGAQNTTPVVTINGTSYSSQQLLGLPAVTGNFTYDTSSGSKTDAVEGVSLASLLSGVADSDTVTFTAWDSATYSTDGYTMTKAQLVADNAVLAYAVNGSPVKNATYGPSPTLYLDGMKPAKNIMDVTSAATQPVTPADPVVLTITGAGSDLTYTIPQLQAMTPVSGNYTYTGSSGVEKTNYVQGVAIADVLAGIPDDATISFTAADGFSTANYTMTKAQLVAANAVIAYAKGTSAADLAPITNDYDNAPSLYLNGVMPAQNINQIGVSVPEPEEPPSETTTVTVTVTPQTLTLAVGDTSTPLTAQVSPASKTGGVTWKSDNAQVATVSSTGAVTGVKVGVATITATSVDDPTVSASATVTVTAASPGGDQNPGGTGTGTGTGTNTGSKGKANSGQNNNGAATSTPTTSTATTKTASSSLPTTGDSLGLGGIFISVMALAFSLSFLITSRRQRYV